MCRALVVVVRTWEVFDNLMLAKLNLFIFVCDLRCDILEQIYIISFIIIIKWTRIMCGRFLYLSFDSITKNLFVESV